MEKSQYRLVCMQRGDDEFWHGCLFLHMPRLGLGRAEDPSLQEVKSPALQNFQPVTEGRSLFSTHAEMVADEFASCSVALEQIYRFCDKF